MKNYRFKRIFVIVADSMGSGYLPDADKFGDKGSNTLVHIGEKMPNGLNVPVYLFIILLFKFLHSNCNVFLSYINCVLSHFTHV